MTKTCVCTRCGDLTDCANEEGQCAPCAHEMAYQREYWAKYRERPGVRERLAAYQRAYFARPEVVERERERGRNRPKRDRAEYFRQYRQRQKENP